MFREPLTVVAVKVELNTVPSSSACPEGIEDKETVGPVGLTDPPQPLTQMTGSGKGEVICIVPAKAAVDNIKKKAKYFFI